MAAEAIWAPRYGPIDTTLDRQAPVVRALAESERRTSPCTTDSRARQHDDERERWFEQLYFGFDHNLRAHITRMTGDEQTGCDLAQETFLRAWQNYDRLKGYDHPSSWLFRVASNLAISWLRRKRCQAGNATVLDDDDGIANTDPVQSTVIRDSITRLLATLPKKQRAVLILRELYGMNADEVARCLGMSREAVKMSLWRARDQFRRRYNAET